MTVLVIRSTDAESLTKYFGGQWQPLTPPFGDSQDYSKVTSWPMVGRRLASYANQRQTERYQVQIFRRVAP